MKKHGKLQKMVIGIMCCFAMVIVGLSGGMTTSRKASAETGTPDYWEEPEETETPDYWEEPEETETPDYTEEPEATETPFSATIQVTTDNGNVILHNGDTKKLSLYKGKAGKISVQNLEYDGEIYWEYSTYDDEVVTVGDDGKILASGEGTGYIQIRGYDNDYNQVFYAQINVTVSIKMLSMKGVTLSNKSIKVYMARNEYGYYSSVQKKIKIKSKEKLSEDREDVSMNYKSSNKKMWVDCYLNNNVLEFDVSGKGTTTVTITINGKVFKVKISVYYMEMNSKGVLLAKGEKKTFQLKGTKEKVKIKWSTSNQKVATISSKGIVKAKKTGTAIIKAKIGGVTVGSIVTVTSKQKKKTVNYAEKMAAHSTYSQPKRMQKGYYDCSSLVWRSYHACSNITLGSRSYAPVAADIGKYLATKHRVVTYKLSDKQIQSRKLNAGDLLFKVGENNGRYRGIYHVEMFAGYEFVGFTSKGKAVVMPVWANRSSDYLCYGDMVGRP